ncbi:hypothetical protein [Caballeronia sp. BR00000012568055]|uniref:hypothetical protein n=1 Tax=Caballeronia sp. BR00000012568055 TaxID=2918761 RepID=UPI0023F899BD|nr:hypothetical protein [Caballeronia sp. BR00000012568055]
MDDEAQTEATPRDARWRLCGVPGCPLVGTIGRAGQWWCYCHFDADTSANDAITRVIRKHRAVYLATVDVRASIGTDGWPRMYRTVQERLLDAQCADLMPCELDASPYRPGRPIVSQWLARLERYLHDAARAELQRMARDATPEAVTRRAPLPSRDCVARMRATLAPIAARVLSPRWAFELLDGIARKPTHAPPPEALRAALDAIRSQTGRAYVANATDEQRARWRAALESIGGTAAGLMPSRVPGEDDEPMETNPTESEAQS